MEINKPPAVLLASPSHQPGGRLVANAVTLEMEAVLLARHGAMGGTLTRIAVARAEPSLTGILRHLHHRLA